MPVCIECAHEVESLFSTYGKDNIVLTRCKNCGEIADKYVEFDGIVQAIDLILHKLPVYRHLLLNHPLHLSKLHKALFLIANALIDLFCSLHFGMASASNRVIISLLIRSITGSSIYYLIIWMILGENGIQNALILGSFPRLLHVLFFVWEYRKDGTLDTLVTLATLTSHFMALRAICNSTTRVVLAIFVSYLIRILLHI